MIPTKPRIQQDLQRIPGIPCPHCGNFIPTNIQQILFSSCLFCPTCGLKLNIDKRKSDKALKILAKIDEAQKRVEDSSKFTNTLKSNKLQNNFDINKIIKEIILIPENNETIK